MCESCGCEAAGAARVIEVGRRLLEENDKAAERNRRWFTGLGMAAVNLVSSPGAGKTTLLEATIERLSDLRLGVVEGDIETDRDCRRIRDKGVAAVQLTTGGGCHLDARMVHEGVHRLLDEGGGPFDLLFIENVGNLVCPAGFDLGEHRRVVLLSVPEGSDKPAKYPKAFAGSDLFLITKTDLLPHFDFSVQEARREARRLNPAIETIELSAVRGDGMAAWERWLRQLAATGRAMRDR